MVAGNAIKSPRSHWLRAYSAGAGGGEDGVFWGVASDAAIISSMIFLKSAKPGAGMMIVSRRPFTSSVIRKNRPRGFSRRVKTNILRSIATLSVLMVSSLEGGLGDQELPCGCRFPYGDGLSLEIIYFPFRSAHGPMPSDALVVTFVKFGYLSNLDFDFLFHHHSCRLPVHK